MLRGNVLIEANEIIYSFNVSRIISIENPQTQVESAIQGPQLALKRRCNTYHST